MFLGSGGRCVGYMMAKMVLRELMDPAIFSLVKNFLTQVMKCQLTLCYEDLTFQMSFALLTHSFVFDSLWVKRCSYWVLPSTICRDMTQQGCVNSSLHLWSQPQAILGSRLFSHSTMLLFGEVWLVASLVLSCSCRTWTDDFAWIFYVSVFSDFR
jgi:hypothetical protein